MKELTKTIVYGPCPVCFDHIKPCKCYLRERIIELEQSLALLVEASAPYLKRKNVTKKADRKFLNKSCFVAKEVLKR